MSEYLKNLNELIETDSSQIKILIQDLPNLLLNSIEQPEESCLLFSRLDDPSDRRLLCNLLSLLVGRLGVSARRSKQAFTSMWDRLKRCLEIILMDALTVVTGTDFELEILLRRILQLGDIGENVDEGVVNVDISVWLAMDLSVQLKKKEVSRFPCTLLLSNPKDLELELNQKTLLLYCQQFHIEEFPIIFKDIPDPSSELITLYFKNYYNTEITSEIIKNTSPKFKIEFIQNLKTIHPSEWLKFDSNILVILLFKLKINLNPKEDCAIFDLLSEITLAIDLRPDSKTLLKQLCVIQSSIPVDGLTDSSLSKYWCFVSALLSCEGIENDLNLENWILFTLKCNFHSVKAKTSVCRVIALYWNRLTQKAQIQITDLLMYSIRKYENNKLKWNIAIALVNVEGSTEVIDRL